MSIKLLKNQDVDVYIPPTALTPSEEGLVPAALFADVNKFLKANGTWDTPSTTGLSEIKYVPPAIISGQISFTLPSLPSTMSFVRMNINDMPYVEGEQFTRVGVNITWLQEFTLEPQDRVFFTYYV